MPLPAYLHCAVRCVSDKRSEPLKSVKAASNPTLPQGGSGSAEITAHPTGQTPHEKFGPVGLSPGLRLVQATPAKQGVSDPGCGGFCKGTKKRFPDSVRTLSAILEQFDHGQDGSRGLFERAAWRLVFFIKAPHHDAALPQRATVCGCIVASRAGAADGTAVHVRALLCRPVALPAAPVANGTGADRAAPGLSAAARSGRARRCGTEAMGG